MDKVKKVKKTKEEKEAAARERFKADMAARKAKRLAREARPENIAKQQAEKQAEINAMQGIKNETEEARKIRERMAARSRGRQVGSSAENKKWEEKRKARYDQTVWKGWRDREDTKNPVKVLKKGDTE